MGAAASKCDLITLKGYSYGLKGAPQVAACWRRRRRPGWFSMPGNRYLLRLEIFRDALVEAGGRGEARDCDLVSSAQLGFDEHGEH